MVETMEQSDWISKEVTPSEKGVYVGKFVHLTHKTISEYLVMYLPENNRWSASYFGHSRSECITHWRPITQDDLIRFKYALDPIKPELKDWINTQIAKNKEG